MTPVRLIGLVLLVGGILALVYGGFSYTSDTHRAELGPMTMEMAERDHFNIPLWAGVGAILLGGVLLLSRRRPD